MHISTYKKVNGKLCAIPNAKTETNMDVQFELILYMGSSHTWNLSKGLIHVGFGSIAAKMTNEHL